MPLLDMRCHRSRSWVPWLAGASVAAVGLLLPHRALGDVIADTHRLRGAWSSLGKPQLLQPRMLERGEPVTVPLPPHLLQQGEGCLTVAVLGSPTTTFSAGPAARSGRSTPSSWPTKSVAGAVQLSQCGADRRQLHALTIDMRSPRALVTVLAVHAPVPLPPITTHLSERDPGPDAALGVVEIVVPARTLEERLKSVLLESSRAGAAEVTRLLVPADNAGTGQTPIELEPGCHSLTVLSGMPPGERVAVVDVDAQLEWMPPGKPAITDTSDAMDGQLEACVAERRTGLVRFVGALPGAPVIIMRSTWLLPKGLPSRWGTEVEAAFADVFIRSRVTQLDRPPFFTSLGTGGTTAVPVETPVGGCYLAAVVGLDNTPSGLTLGVLNGSTSRANNAGMSSGTIAAFCATSTPHTLVEIDAPRLTGAWMLAVWRTGGAEIGAEVE